MKRVAIGISGGVDSSVSAYLLKQQGYDVVGLFMINWHDAQGTLEGKCTWEDDLIFAELTAKKLNIPLQTVDLSKEYKTRVVDYMFSEYKMGRTPNPDILCNREVKFDLFIKEALKFNADLIATGHYCQKDTINVNGSVINRLLAGHDPNKDQSYFLCQLSQQQLQNVIFPIGNLHKFEVRKIAGQQELATAGKKDSQGICFVGKVDLPTFLQQKLTVKKGRIIEVPEEIFLDDNEKISLAMVKSLSDGELESLSSPLPLNPSYGKQVGLHNGAHFYTIGQNKGLNIGGRPKASFVINIDTEKNLIYTGLGKEHAGLYRQGLVINKNEVHWVRPDLALNDGETSEYNIRIRYRQPLQKAVLVQRKNKLYIIFEKKQRGIAPGQFAAWYQKDELIGSGPIAK